jgi:tetratricopeptide (TPR) repeat protein
MAAKDAHVRIVVSQAGPPSDDAAGYSLIPLRTHAGDALGPCVIYRIAAEDRLEERLATLIENKSAEPFIDSAVHDETMRHIRDRGLALAGVASLPVLFPGDESLDQAVLEIVGELPVMREIWESLQTKPSSRPWAVDRPLVRVLGGTHAYPHEPIGNTDDVRVLVITGRTKPFSDIPPRQIAKPLLDLTTQLDSLRLGVVSPAWPGQIDSALTDTGPHSTPNVLHIDCHGLLIEYGELQRQFGERRRQFIEQSWGRPIERYEGLKGFVRIDWNEGSLPVSGEELADLCKRAGVVAVVLNACESGSSRAESSLAADLVRGGVPEVVAVRHKISPTMARIFTRGFYSALAQGTSVGEAASNARRSLYEERWRWIGDDRTITGDWLSVVHYAAEHGRPPAARTDIKPHQTLSVESQTLPTTLEWKIWQLQECSQRQLIERQTAAPDSPDQGPFLMIAGPIGLGTERVAVEAAEWIASTDLGYRGARVLDFSRGVDRAILAKVTRELLRPEVIVFAGIDLGTDRGLISRKGLASLRTLASRLTKIGHLCLLPTTRSIASAPRTLAAGAVALPIYPIEHHISEGHIIPGPDVAIEAETAILLRLSTWVSAGFGDIVMALARPPEADALREFLDYFVGGASSLPPAWSDLSAILAETEVRYGLLNRAEELDPLRPALAALGSGIVITELLNVGQPLSDDPAGRFADPTVQAMLRRLVEYYEQNLVAVAAPHTVPREWNPSGDWPHAYLSNPFLRPIARAQLTDREKRALDEWTVGFAISKMNAFSSRYEDRSERTRIQPYIDHARPTLAAALWTVVRNAMDPTEIREAIETGIATGWWPTEMDPSPLFKYHGARDAGTDEYAQLLKDGIGRQRAGDFTGSREAFTRALELSTSGGSLRSQTFPLLRLATVAADEGRPEEALRLLELAERSRLKAGPQRLAPEIAYEQACALKQLGRLEDATSRFRASIVLARKHGLPHVECRSFQELADVELQTTFVAGELGPDNPVRISIAQAEDYIRRAEEAAALADAVADERPQHLLLKARVALLRGDVPIAKRVAVEARDGFEALGDRRRQAAANFLVLVHSAESLDGQSQRASHGRQ